MENKMNNVTTISEWRSSTYNEIVNMAHKLDHKVKKQEVLEIVQQFMLYMEENRLNHIADSDLARLYSYFRCTPLKKEQTPAHWVGKAVAVLKKNISIDSLNYLYSDGETLWGTDGHQLHWIRAGRQFPEGFYDPKTLDPLECPYQYPACRNFIEGWNIDYEKIYHKHFKNLEIVEMTLEGKKEQVVKITEPFETYVSLKRVRDAYNGDQAMFWHFSTKDNGLEPIFLQSEDNSRNAVIMPINKPEN
jgi:hypothetical protein